jgi:malate synthase
MTTSLIGGTQILGTPSKGFAEILTPKAMAFVVALSRRFSKTRLALLEKRKQRQSQIDAGQLLDFLSETKSIRQADWKVAPVRAELQDRRVEITGPVDRKMVINALNSGCKVFMADFEDSNSPTWENVISGQINLRDAVRGTIEHTAPGGKHYALNENPAVLFVRPRGWHLTEKHFLIDGQPVSASLFDFGLYAFHNAQTTVERGHGPYFYLPKLESHLEARLWNDVFVMAESELGLAAGTIKATVLIETILAAFEMDEILYELRDHSAGLNCGRWDYIFSCIKKFRHQADFCLADRALISMATPFMRAYSLLTIKTCHRRGAHAIGGMAAQIPIKNDSEANQAAFEKVRDDKEREARDGHDGTWVAHPGLVQTALKAFDAVMPQANQIHRKPDDIIINTADLLNFKPQGPITEAGLRININVALQYLGSWLGGVGCVPIFNLMEDAATAEISRAQIWHWVHSAKGILEDGQKVTVDLFAAMLEEELEQVRRIVGETAFSSGIFHKAAKLLEQLVTDQEFVEFLTLPAYDMI